MKYGWMTDGTVLLNLRCGDRSMFACRSCHRVITASEYSEQHHTCEPGPEPMFAEPLATEMWPGVDHWRCELCGLRATHEVAWKYGDNGCPRCRGKRWAAVHRAQ